MHQSAEDVITQYLDPGEKLLWAGRPRGGVRLRAQDVFLIPFSLFWGGFAIFWEYSVSTMTAHARGPVPVIFPLFGVPFVCVGLYLIFGRFFVDAKGRERTYYGVTNERAIIIRGLFSRQTKSLQLRAVADVSLSQRTDGSGTITFGQAPMFGAFSAAGGSWPGTGRYAAPSFDMIEGAKEVYDIVRNAQRQS